MPKKIKIILMLLLVFCVVLVIDNRIYTQDLRFYQGKDNGFSARLISVCLLSALFYSVLTENHKVKMFVFGFVIGLVASISSYFIWFFFFDDYGLSFHVIACTLFIILYFFNESRNGRSSPRSP